MKGRKSQKLELDSDVHLYIVTIFYQELKNTIMGDVSSLQVISLDDQNRVCVELTALSDEQLTKMTQSYMSLQKKVVMRELDIPSGVDVSILDEVIRSGIRNDKVHITVLPEQHCCRILGCSVDDVDDTKAWIESLIKDNWL